MSAASHPASSAIKEFLLRIRELSPAEASPLFEQLFPPGDELRDEARRFWQRADQQREAALQPEPGWNEREELKTAGYELQRKLGSGGGGSVYLAIQQHPRRTVAVKFLATKLGREGAIRMQREIELTCKIQHPDLVELYVAGETSRGRPYFVMEYVYGVDVFAQCQCKGWTLKTRLRLMVRVCEAVATLHRRGVIHQDLKAGNILVTEQAHPKIIDFGIARSVYADWQDERVARLYSEPPRTEDYAAPEQRIFVLLDTSVDSFALGRVLLKLLTGELCDSDKPVAPSRSAISLDPRMLGFAGDAALRKRYHGDLDAIVLKATAPEPGNRYREAGALAEDLERFLSSRPVSAVPNTPAYEARLFVRRNPLWVAAVAVLIATLAAAAGFAFWQSARAMKEARLARERAAQALKAREVSNAMAKALDRAMDEFSKRMVADVDQQQAAMRELYIELADTFKNPPEAQYTFLNRALRSMSPGHPRYHEVDRRSSDLARQYGFPPRGSTVNIPPGVTPLINLNMVLQLAVLRLGAGDHAADLNPVRETLSRALPYLKDDADGRFQVQQTVCDTGAAAQRLRLMVPGLEVFCR